MQKAKRLQLYHFDAHCRRDSIFTHWNSLSCRYGKLRLILLIFNVCYVVIFSYVTFGTCLRAVWSSLQIPASLWLSYLLNTCILQVLHIISSAFIEILDYNIVNTLILFTNFFIIVSYPINFAIYCGMSRQFRETFKELFIRGTVQVTRRNGGSSKYSLVNGPRTCTNETVL